MNTREKMEVDYGVYPVPYSKLEQKLNALTYYVKDIVETTQRCSDKELYLYEWEVKPQIKRLMFELEDAMICCQHFIITILITSGN